MAWKLGACSWIFGVLPLEEVARGLSRFGYHGVELLGDPRRYPPQKVRRLLPHYGLSVFSLTPLDVDLAHPDPEVRGRAGGRGGLLPRPSGPGAAHRLPGRGGRAVPGGVACLAERAEGLGIGLALGVLLETYHMNVGEADLPGAIRLAGPYQFPGAPGRPGRDRLPGAADRGVHRPRAGPVHPGQGAGLGGGGVGRG